tara:strand:+ start:722 stop:907 length:186 start_codon:yes stop_codon:yes gene_type:complete
MKITNAPDKRPAIAFDSKIEVLSIINALRLYREEMNDGHTHKLQMLIDECEEVLEMFKDDK